MIGDSFVEAKEVVIADKFHVGLETLAARELPSLDVTTSAFGHHSTGQINQLPFYDEYARHSYPKLVVLVVTNNDFADNSTTLRSIATGPAPWRIRYVMAERDGVGKISLIPPFQDPRYVVSIPSKSKFAYYNDVWNSVRGISPFANWLHRKATIVFFPDSFKGDRAEKVKMLSEIPRYAPLVDGWSPTMFRIRRTLARVMRDPQSAKEDFPSAFHDALDMTAFALDQFKARADRDDAELVILASHTLGGSGNAMFDWMSDIAEARGIPVIDQYDYIIRQNGNIKDAHWPHDIHWSPTGHRWAAEALLEYLKQHPEVCDREFLTNRS